MKLLDRFLRHGDLNTQFWRADFPILQTKVHGKPLVYLDNAATTQKPLCVIEAERDYYHHYNANVHRGIHNLSQRATSAYEEARARVQRFINAKVTGEIIFVRGTTEAINLVAQSYGRNCLHEGDEIILSQMEHHSNIVPWQILCHQTGAILRVITVDDHGELQMESFRNLLNEHTRFVAVTHVSNTMGTINPVREIINLAHQVGAPVLLDGAQAVAHLAVDVQELDCDFYAFSGHKLYAPTGVGVLYGKAALLDAMPPYQGGGDMIRSVSFAETSYNALPYKFEAGTPNIAGVIGLGAAVEYVNSIGFAAIVAHEKELLAYAMQLLAAVPGLTIIGNAREKIGIISFVLDGIHAHDIGTVLDRQGVAIRTGHHCTMPLMQRFNLPATARASFALYNTTQDVDALVSAIYKVKEVFSQ
jgi:cysteine desulfurase/selenocysteine lyase